MQSNKNQVWLAPMDGWTDWALRRAIKDKNRYDNVTYFAEFVHVQSLIRDIYNNKKILYRLKNEDDIAQLYGQDEEAFFKASQMLIKQGFKGIDINMGCSIRKIATRGDGAGLIRDRENAIKVIRAVKKAVKQSGKNITISIKTRLGFDKDDGENWISLLVQEQPDWITIHGRTYAQGFSGKANWSRVGEIAKYVTKNFGYNKIVGNGDIKSIEQAHDLQEKYNLYATMIGRNLRSFIIDPTRDINEQKITITSFLIKYLSYHREHLSKFFGSEKSAYDYTKKISIIMLKGLSNIKQLKIDLLVADNYDRALEVLAL